MHLYLIRHADAVDRADDAVRELSARGRQQVKAMAEFLARPIFQPIELWHSPLVRARETAELLVVHGGFGARLRETDGLTPDDAVEQIAARLARASVDSLGLVGHEPHLSALASLLLGAGVAPVRVAFPKCAVLALEGAGEYWAVDWFVSPSVIGAR